MASLALAFATDSEISMKINQCSRLTGNLRALMKEICHYCTENELRFYAVFDQHNEISENDQDTYPYSLPTILFHLPNFTGQVIVSATSDNSYKFRTAEKNRWPTFTIIDRFTDVEAVHYLQQLNFFCPNPPFLKTRVPTYESILEVTACVPLQLSNMVEIKDANCHLNMIAVEAEYKRSFALRWRNDEREFHHRFARTPQEKEAVLRAVSYMEEGVPVPSDDDKMRLLNLQLMYETEDHIIKAVTPIAKDAITAYWQKCKVDETLEETPNIT